MSAKPAKSAAPAKAETPAAEAPKKGHKLLIIIIAVLVLVIAGGVGWYFTMGKSASHAEVAKVEPPKEPKFVTLEPFTVNLQREEGDQYLQIGMSLKILEPELEEKIKGVLPEIRSKLLLLLSSKKASELNTAAGKKKLVAEIISEINSILGIHKEAHAAAPAAASAVAETAPHSDEETPAAHEEHAATSEVAPAEAHAETAAAHAEPQAAGKEAGGIADVLFTSFIIQ